MAHASLHDPAPVHMSETSTRTEWRERPPAAQRRGGSLRSALRSGRLPALGLILLAVALVYWPSSAALAGYWTDTADRTYTHGYLILLTALWLIVRDREALEAAPIRPVPLALAAVLGLSAAWLLFWHAAVQDLHLLLLPLIAFAAILAALGRSIARIVLFPLAFLYFAMPVWSDLVGVLQQMSIAANDVLIRLTGLPAFLQGDLVHLPAGTLEIAEGCSGLHFLIVGLALAALYGELSRDSLLRRIEWLALMGALALVANWLRIFVIVVAGYATDMRTFLITVDHYWFGWGVFAVAFAAFLWLAGRLSGPPAAAGAGPPPTAPAAGAPGRVSLARCLIAVGALAALPLLAASAELARAAPRGAVTLDWPIAHGAWSGPQPPSAAATLWSPLFENASTTSLEDYVAQSGRTVEIYAAVYRTQRQGAKLVAYGNSLLGGAHAPLAPVAHQIIRGASGPWRELELAGPGGGRSLLWAQYRIGERRFASGRRSQLWYGLASFASEPVSALIALRTECESDCALARARLAAAAVNLVPAVQIERAQAAEAPP